MQIKGWKEIYGKVEKGNLRIDWLQLLSEGGCQVFFFRVCFFFFFPATGSDLQCSPSLC
jgi:hypothetical protein